MDKQDAVKKLSEVDSMERVLRECFGGDPHAMRAAAEHFMLHGRPPTDLGIPYRNALGSRARRPWWTSLLRRLDELESKKQHETFDVDSISELRAAWSAVLRGRTILLADKGRVFAEVSPVDKKTESGGRKGVRL